jgi:predicted RNA methylase
MTSIKPNEIVYDLGCGDGRVLIMAAKHFNARAIGIEIDPIRFLWCKFRIRLLGLGDKVQVIYGDFFRKNLSNADIIICYLLQNTNDKLQAKL